MYHPERLIQRLTILDQVLLKIWNKIQWLYPKIACQNTQIKLEQEFLAPSCDLDTHGSISYVDVIINCMYHQVELICLKDGEKL